MVAFSDMSQFHIDNDENQFFYLGGFFSSIIEINGYNQHPIVLFTLSASVSLQIYHITLQLLTCRTPLFIPSPPLNEIQRFLLKKYILEQQLTRSKAHVLESH